MTEKAGRWAGFSVEELDMLRGAVELAMAANASPGFRANNNYDRLYALLREIETVLHPPPPTPEDRADWVVEEYCRQMGDHLPSTEQYTLRCLVSRVIREAVEAYWAKGANSQAPKSMTLEERCYLEERGYDGDNQKNLHHRDSLASTIANKIRAVIQGAFGAGGSE